MDFSDECDFEGETRAPDPVEQQAEGELRVFFESRPEQVFFSRQIEIAHEDRFFHWITNRALRSLIEQGLLATEEHRLNFGGRVKLIWMRAYRYYKRRAAQVVQLVGEYSHPSISEGLGRQGEVMVLEALARNGFSILGRNAIEYGGRRWAETGHDLDIIVEKDGLGYGVEVKNTLQYISQDDYRKKKEICGALGLRPLFAVRMMPKTWIHELRLAGGYSMILKNQLYPWGQKELARRVAEELGLPVVCAGAIEQGTLERFLAWHVVNLRPDSH